MWGARCSLRCEGGYLMAFDLVSFLAGVALGMIFVRLLAVKR